MRGADGSPVFYGPSYTPPVRRPASLRSPATPPGRGISPRSRRRAAVAGGRVRLATVALVALLASVLLALLAGCAAPAPDGKGLTRIRAAGVLRWGADTQGGEPYVYDDPAKPGHMVGFEVELAAAIARELGVRAEMVQNDWANLVPSLERGTFDGIFIEQRCYTLRSQVSAPPEIR